MKTTTGRLIAVAAAGVLGVGSLVVAAELPANAASTVAINGATTYQTIDGFGVSEAFGQANGIRNVGNATVQKQILDMLFSPATGAGLSILRNLIPSDASHTMEPTAPSGPNATPNYVWDANNGATDWGQLWLSKQAKTYGVALYNDAWSAPGFMKTNGTENNGGSLCGTPGASCGSGDWRQAYANYLVQHTKNWAGAGVTPQYLGFANEPSYVTSYSSMLVNPAQAANFAAVLGPTLKATGLDTKITCCETLGWGLLPSYVTAVEGNATAASAVGVYTSHGYAGGPNSKINTAGKSVWETEWSPGSSVNSSAWDDGSAASGFSWAQNLYNGMVNASLTAFFYWWGISSGTATSGSTSLAYLNGSSVTTTKRLYTFANYGRFVRPGAVRIGATSGDSNLRVGAYRNTDGSVAIVVLNAATSDTSTSFSVSGTGVSNGSVTPYLTNSGNSTAAQPAIALSGGSFTATVPARSLVTYRIAGGSTPPPSPSPSSVRPSSAGPSPSPSQSSAASSSPSASASPSSTSGTPVGHGCTATYTVSSGWPGGFQVDVTVTNSGPSTVNGWTVTWPLPAGQGISQVWNGTLSTSGGTATVKNVSYNGTLAPGATASFGLIGTGPSTPVPSLSCTSP